MKKHICVFLAFQNVEHVITSFNSMYVEGIDFFIVENYSSKSEAIKEFFISQKNKISGYIQFQENIAANAINMFIKDFYKLLSSYEIITITDGDLYLYDAKSFFEEILQNLNLPNVMISSGNLYLDNNYVNTNPVVGIDKYIEKCTQRTLPYKANIGNTAANLITFKVKDLEHIKNVYYIDTFINNKVKSLNRLWVHTNKNIAYHLTWDLYREGEEYFTWKKAVIKEIWKITKEAQYIKLI
jgi:hypothetical protein